jgi:hypothetical protein
VGSCSILFGSLRSHLSAQAKRCGQRPLARLPCWGRFAELSVCPNCKTDSRRSSRLVATAAEKRLNILRITSFAAASDCQNRVPSLLLCRSRSLPERKVVYRSSVLLCSGLTMLAGTVNFSTRRAPSPKIRARDTLEDGPANGTAGVNRAPNMDAGINSGTHLSG